MVDLSEVLGVVRSWSLPAEVPGPEVHELPRSVTQPPQLVRADGVQVAVVHVPEFQ
jgi:hypothetical protein